MDGCARAWNMKIQYCRECIIDMKLITKNKSLFGISKFLYDSAFLNDPNYGPYQVASASIQTKPASINVNTCTPVESTYQSTKLSSGITVLTESVSVPSNVQLGVFVDVGSRDENAESSGATLLLKNAHLKTAISTNETVNYGIIQMAGAELNLDYGRESGFYRINCLSHDVIDVFSMLVDVALEPRNSVACAVGRSKNEESHLVDAQTGGNQLFNDHLFAAAFQNKSLGRPVFGTRSNVANLTSEVIQKFQLANFTHDRIVISATGIENHQEFVDLVSEKMNLTQLANNAPQRESAKYIGGEIRNFNESSIVHVALAFEGAQYTQGWPLLIANEILNGNSFLTQLKDAQDSSRPISSTRTSLSMMLNPSPPASPTLACLGSNCLAQPLMYPVAYSGQ